MSSAFKNYSLCLIAVLAIQISASEWTVKDDANTELPGRKVDVKLDDKLVARFIYGEGQIKPYLNVFGEEGDELTRWDPKQTFPHHRGIFIGWNKIGSDLGGPIDKKTNAPTPKGTFDLWHFNNGGKMDVVKFEKLEGGKDAATIVATIAWHAGNKDKDGSDLLLTETRTLVISRPTAKKTQVDAKFELKAARDISLGGDLQHAGVHFRGSAELLNRQTETLYVWEPNVPNNGGKAVSKEFKYARLIFPLGERRYTSTHLNSPKNPVDELSTREYGRFGYFFTKELKKDEVLPLQYRIITELCENLKNPPVAAKKEAPKADPKADPKAEKKPGIEKNRSKISDEDDATQRKEAQAEYDEFLKSIAK